MSPKHFKKAIRTQERKNGRHLLKTNSGGAEMNTFCVSHGPGYYTESVYHPSAHSRVVIPRGFGT